METGERNVPGRKKIIVIAVFAVIYLAALLAGQALSIGYETTPGEAGASPGNFPANCGIERKEGMMTVLVFIHPMCSCSRATLAELEKIISRCHDRIRPTIILLLPEGVGPDWENTEVCEYARSIPYVGILSDQGGALSRRFGALTSGYSVMYDSQGRLVFNGGITGSRGHLGDNRGSDAIISIASRGAEKEAAFNQVFGCPMFEGKP